MVNDRSSKICEETLSWGYTHSQQIVPLPGYDERMQEDQTIAHTPSPRFESTQWSLVLSAGNASSPRSHRALAELCEKYWLPLYAHVRRLGRDPDQASDLTQGFFAKLIEKNYVADADERRGRFRTFLLASFTNFIANEWDKSQAAKRGGGQVPWSFDFAVGEKRFREEPENTDTPDKQFERQWAISLLEHVLQQLKSDYAENGKSELFSSLQSFLTPHAAERYSDVAKRLGMSPGAVKVAVHRLRLRYRDKLMEEIAATVAHREDVQNEIHRLFETFSS